MPAVLALATGLAVGGILKLAPVPALFAGLSNGGVITVAGMLVIAKGVVKTGVIARATWRLLATVTTAAQALRRLIVPVGRGVLAIDDQDAAGDGPVPVADARPTRRR